MTAGAITALIFRKLKQITIKESLGVGKTCCIARFPYDSTAFVFSFLLSLFYLSLGLLYICYSVAMEQCMK